MRADPLARMDTVRPFAFFADRVHLRTDRRQRFIDITAVVTERVRRSGIYHGMVNVQVAHTTAGVVLNEFEPELLRDLDDMTESLAPRASHYRHDARADAPAGEPANGHAHARAVLLGSSVTLNVIAGEVVLGRWQHVLLAELDGPRKRELSIAVLGIRADGPSCPLPPTPDRFDRRAAR